MNRTEKICWVGMTLGIVAMGLTSITENIFDLMVSDLITIFFVFVGIRFIKPLYSDYLILESKQ